MKKRFEWSKSPTAFDIRIGDYVRVKGKDGWIRDYEEVVDVEKTSLELKVGGTWPISRVCSRTSQKVAEEQTRRDAALRKIGFNPGGTSF